MSDKNEPRQYSAGRPVMRISDATTHEMERLIIWEELNNEYNLLSYNWTPRAYATPTEVEGGRIYPHFDGGRLHAVLEFTYWDEGFTIENVPVFFTEHDYQWVKIAQGSPTTLDIEFFPFDSIPMGTAPNAKFVCGIVELTRVRSEANTHCWNCRLEVEGLRRVAAADIPVY